MTSYEFNGKSVKEAIDKACEELKVEEALLEVEVVQESTRGFLGIVGHREAIVRVRRRDILREVMEADKPAATARRSNKQADGPPADAASTDPVTAPAQDEEDPEQAAGREYARQVLTDILSRMSVDAEVRADKLDQAAYLDIKGDGSGLLIGKQGQTLDALEYLVNKIVNRSRPMGSKLEVIVDSEKYRLRKREQFREKTLKKGAQAKRTMKPVSFPPMPANERRLVHMILADDNDVITKSVGEGARRRIIVYPRRGGGSKRRRR